MESVLGEDCQDPIPATLTLNQAEMQGRDWTDPAQVMGARAAAAGTAQIAGPAWSFVGSHLPGSPKLTVTSVPSCVVGPQACNSAMLIGKTLRYLVNCGVRVAKKGREMEEALARGQLPSAGCKEGCSGCLGRTWSFWGPMCHPVPGEGQGLEEFYYSAMTDVSPGKWIPLGRC